MAKITVIGAGNVGATCVNAMNMMQFAGEIVLLDIKPGIAEGKAIDMMQTAKLLRFDTKITGVTNNYEATAKSMVVVVSSGLPRKPGMSREDLISTNAEIVDNVVENALKYSPNAVFVMISNPMDTLTYLTIKRAKLSKHKVIGMGGILDSNRFVYYLKTALGAPASDVAGMVIGGHSDTTMIPLTRFANLRGIPVSELISNEKLDKIANETKIGGAILTKHLGTSAWYAPGAAAAALVRSIVLDEKKIYPCSVMLEGEYSQNDICLGVPIVVGRKGWERIVQLNLNEEEKADFQRSADTVRLTNEVLKDLNLL